MPKLSIRNVSLLLSLLIVLFWAYAQQFAKEKTPPEVLGTWLEPGSELQDFKLSDSQGESFEKDDFLGRWTVLSFGFTHCPDVCPTTLAYFRDEIKALDPAAKDKTQFVFVGVDPERDPAPALGAFTANFHPEIKAVTGSIPELEKFAKIFHAYFKKEGQTKDGLYNLAHSPQYFVINPKGEWRVLYTPPMAKGALALDLQKLENNRG